MIGTFNALKSLCPTASFQLDEDNYDNLIWHSPEISIPTIEEIEEEITRLQSLDDEILYQRLRAPEYPDLKDFADAYYWAQKGDDTKMNEYLAKCEAVKLKYPKPS